MAKQGRWTKSAQSIGTSATVLAFDTEVGTNNLHGTFTTGAAAKYTANKDITVTLSLNVNSSTISWTADYLARFEVYVDGTLDSYIWVKYESVSDSKAYYASGERTVNLSSGSYVDIRCFTVHNNMVWTSDLEIKELN